MPRGKAPAFARLCWGSRWHEQAGTTREMARRKQNRRKKRCEVHHIEGGRETRGLEEECHRERLANLESLNSEGNTIPDWDFMHGNGWSVKKWNDYLVLLYKIHGYSHYCSFDRGKVLILNHWSKPRSDVIIMV